MECKLHIKNNYDLIGSVNNVIDADLPLVSNLSNISRVIMDYIPNTDWSGFYLANETQEYLYLGPFQGSIATMKISLGMGVCGKAALKKESILVPNVHKFEGHIACSSLSNSEVVVPIIKDDKVVGVIDLDSNLYNNFTLEHVKLLEKVANIISKLF